MYLSRVCVRRDQGLAALGRVIVPDDDDRRLDVAHRLIWSLFGDTPDTRRDFLWREEEPGRFVILSRRAPANPGLFEIEMRQFSPALSKGDRLAFRLRANATVATRDGAGKQHRHDVVMNAIQSCETGARAEPRKRELGWLETDDGRIEPPLALRTWLERQGTRTGFSIEALQVISYEKRQIPRDTHKNQRRKSKADVVFGIADLDGILVVHDPEQFVAGLCAGFGRAKAFGCGLMLIKRPQTAAGSA
ncbi:MAG: type I-E CRISPR-associated protein Cas6/Cse3/CasE [Hyphomicrobiaceae bacterium]|nr:type I-E CRISPR-associated protein Cas6/Cse3/CasE [Hyphomicrobiaceae bacterium]